MVNKTLSPRIYFSVAVVPVVFCFSLASLFPGLLLFGTGALYGMMGLGKKYVSRVMGWSRRLLSRTLYYVPHRLNICTVIHMTRGWILLDGYVIS